jgi:hypothetical protein
MMVEMFVLAQGTVGMIAQILDADHPRIGPDHRHWVRGRAHLAGAAGVPIALHAEAYPFHQQSLVAHDLVQSVFRRDDEVAHDEIARGTAEVEEPSRGIAQEFVAPRLGGQIALPGKAK